MRRRLAVTAVVWIAGAAVLRFAVTPPERCPPPDASTARAAIQDAASWIERAQTPDGTYVYEFDQRTGEQSPFYNVVRHAGVTMALYQLAAYGDRSFLDAADRGMKYMEDNLYRSGNWAAFAPPGTDPLLGATALMLAGLEQRRIATHDTSRDALMHELGRFVLEQQRDDGALLERYDRAAGAPAPHQLSRYATGESFWTLAVLHRLFPREHWDVATRR